LMQDAGDVYLNRLSDLLFTFARLENHRAGAGDVEWRKP
jgi:cob(I)alamin adenosyltransferase